MSAKEKNAKVAEKTGKKHPQLFETVVKVLTREGDKNTSNITSGFVSTMQSFPMTTSEDRHPAWQQGKHVSNLGNPRAETIKKIFSL